jgi:hypothetical protein
MRHGSTAGSCVWVRSSIFQLEFASSSMCSPGRRSHWPSWSAPFSSGGSGPTLGTALSVSFLLLTATLQLFAERDFVTSTRIVSRRGLFGRRRREMRLQEIERIEVGSPGLMRREGIGNITVRSARGAITVLAVENAAETAERIEALIRGRST